MYESFRRFDIQTSDLQVTIRGVVGGSGPPVLLLHGNPLTHYHWRFVAPRWRRISPWSPPISAATATVASPEAWRITATTRSAAWRRTRSTSCAIYIRLKLGSQGMGKGGITEDAIQEYVRCCTRSPAGSRDRRWPEPHRQVLRLRKGLVDLRHQPRRLHRAPLRALPGRAGP